MATVQDGEREARLAAEAEVENEREFPPTWDRDTEPRLFGTLVDDRTLDTRFGERRVVTIEREDGTQVDVWVTPARLLKEWEMAAPEVGDYLLLSYHGAIDIGKASPMADLRVRVDRGAPRDEQQELPG